MSTATPRTAPTCLAVESVVANRKSASASLRACAPPRTPGHRVADSRRRSELSQPPNARSVPTVLQGPPAGSPAPPDEPSKWTSFLLSNPIPNLRPSRRLLRTFIRILKQGYRLRAYCVVDELPIDFLRVG